MKKCKVFISSTCYDLADLRRDLRVFLEQNGFTVAVSDDPRSAFYVEPTQDSISSCLLNVETSDAVLLVIDRRYGGLIKDGPHAGRSATHAELQHARKCGKPVFSFIRNVAWNEYEQLKNKPSFKTKWVEDRSKNARRLWTEMVTEVCQLSPGATHSNWRDLFEFSTDLKPLVVKRLLDHFPNHVGAMAMMPERLVRLHFIHSGSHPDGVVHGHFQNVGIGPALNIQHGICSKGLDVVVTSRGALAEGESITEENGKEWAYNCLPSFDPPVLFCEYDNRWGDRYRVEVPLALEAKGYQTSGPDKFFPLAVS